MRLRNIPGAEEKIAASAYVVQNPEEMKGQWKKAVFGNDRPLYIEIGCGKGRFITALSEQNPEVNYLGIEKFSSVLLRCVEKTEELDRPNLRFIRFDAEEILNIFAEGEVNRIYLNFSDPWPKDRHHKRRLTSREYLSRYKEIMTPEALVEFKTDNVGLFDFSLEEIEASGWALLAVTRDLHRDPMNEGNVMTEYEEKFSVLGNKICKLITKPQKETEQR